METNEKAMREYNINVEVYNSKGERNKNKDFILSFVKGDKSRNRDITKRFTVHKNTKYSSLFNEYWFPVLNVNEFITSQIVEPYKSLPKNTIIAFEKEKRKSTQIINFGDYMYTLSSTSKIWCIRYKDKKNKEIKTYPFPSFNGYNISFENCFSDCPLVKVDFSKLLIDRCVSMACMFADCGYLEEVNNIMLCNTPLYDTSAMFAYCICLKKIDMSKCDITIDTLLSTNMFYACSKLTDADITGFKLHGRDDDSPHSLFKYCYSLHSIKCTKETYQIIKNKLPMTDMWIDELDIKHSKDNKKIKGSDPIRNKIIKIINMYYTKKWIIPDILEDEDNNMLTSFDPNGLMKRSASFSNNI